MKIPRTQDEINEQLDKIMENTSEGKTKYPAMTYEQGLMDMYDWLTGITEEKPME